MIDRVDVELLVMPACPHQVPVTLLLRGDLDDVGLTEATFSTTVISTADEAVRRGFIGSPTILINGVDPFAAPGATPALACRLYPNPTGQTGVPAQLDLRQALKRAAAVA